MSCGGGGGDGVGCRLWYGGIGKSLMSCIVRAWPSKPMKPINSLFIRLVTNLEVLAVKEVEGPAPAVEGQGRLLLRRLGLGHPLLKLGRLQLVPGVHAQLRGLGVVLVRVRLLIPAEDAPLGPLLLPLRRLRVEHHRVDKVGAGRWGCGAFVCVLREVSAS